MVQNFDIFNQPEKPQLVLCKPNKEEILELNDAHNIKLKLQFNSVSNLNFSIPKLSLTGSKNLFDEFPQEAGDCKLYKSGAYWVMNATSSTGAFENNLELDNFKYNTQYTFSGYIYELDNADDLQLVVVYKDASYDQMAIPTITETAFSFTSDAGKTIDFVSWTHTVSGGTTYIRSFQIEEGTSATSYEVFNHDYYEDIINEKWIHMTNVGYFVIKQINIVNDGDHEYKEVECNSIDIKIGDKHLVRFSGTYEFYDPITPEGTLLATIIELIPSWDLGTIDSGLWTKYRTFDVSDQSILNFLLTDVSQAYECVFEFDFEDQDINVKELDSVGTDTNIFIGYNNLIQKLTVKEDASELVTCIRAWGSNDLTVRHVNPNGNDRLYNFDYIKDPDFMSQDLIDAINAYEVVWNANQPTYASSLTDWKTKNTELVALNVELVDLQGELTALNTVKLTQIQGGQSISATNILITAKASEITSKIGEINSKEAEITAVEVILDAINVAVSFDSNFTTTEIAELDNFIIENTYQDESFLITDIMTEAEKQDMAQDLYDQAAIILARTSQPRLTFSVDVVDFIKIIDYESFTDELEIGNNITIELREGLFYEVRLMSIEHDWEKDSLSLTFSNKYRMDDPSFTLQDLLNNSYKQSSTVSFGKYIYNDYRESGDKSTISSYMTSALNTAVQNIKSNDDSDITIDTNGILLRQNNGAGGYDDEQLWMVNNMIAMSDDGFDTATIGIGKIQDDNLGEIWGIAAPLIVGTVLASSSLIIMNDANTFTVDADGATLIDATFTVEKSDLTSKITLDPTTGILMQGKIGGTYQDVFSVDTDGRIQANYLDIASDATFGGTLSGADGTFSGTVSAGSIVGSTVTAGVAPNAQIVLDNSGRISFKYSNATKGYIEGYTDGMKINGGSYVLLDTAWAYTSGIITAGSYINAIGSLYCDSGGNPPSSGDRVRNVTYNNSVYCLLSSGYATQSYVTTRGYVTSSYVSSSTFNSGNTHSHGLSSGGNIPWASLSDPPSLPTGTIVGTTDSQTISNKTFISPSISSFSNATHNHSSSFYGGTIAYSALTGKPTGTTGTFTFYDSSANWVGSITVSNGIVTSVSD